MGKALYTFGVQPTVEPTGDLAMFPPFLVPSATNPAVGAGVTGVVGTRALADGTFQVTYNGGSLYTCTADTSPATKSAREFTTISL
jgi:hypothetical protein